MVSKIHKYKLFLAVLVFTLTGCISGPDNRLVVMTPVDKAETSSILVFSTRAKSEKAGVVFSSERGQSTQAAIIEISVPPNHKPGQLELPGRLKQLDPDKHFTARQIDFLKSEDDQAGLDWLNKQTINNSVLIFVHGYNVTFDSAVFSLAQLHHDSGMTAAPVLFAWPSSGRLNGYIYDRESANYSRDALETLIEKALIHPQVEDITLFAHSMGSWLTMEALRQMAIRKGGLPAKINNIVLAAPDLDVDVFVRQVEALGVNRPQITIFSSKSDRALAASRFLAGGARLGSVDTGSKDFAKLLHELGGITVLDLSGVKSGDLLGHSTFLSQPQIVEQLGSGLLNEDAFLKAYHGPGAVIMDVGRLLTEPFTDTSAPATLGSKK